MTGATDSISVVIPARDAEYYLGEAVASVLAQTSPIAEVIVVDDGSTDGTARLAGGLGAPVRCVLQAPSGPGAARNRGVSEARGSLIAFLDADDLWTPDSVAQRLVALRADAGLDAVFGEAEQFLCDRLGADERAGLHLPVRRLPGWVAGSMLARRSVFERVGAFGSSLRAGEFVEWYLRGCRRGMRVAMIDALVLRRRVHATNLGRTDPDGRTDLLAVVREDLAARRRAGQA